MNARLIPTICALLLVAMSLAVAAHWWSLRDIGHTTNAPSAPASPSATPEATPLPQTASTPPAPAAPPSLPASITPRDDFDTTLLRQIENLQIQNRDLIDQLAETNREIMKLEFRVDMHSSQFRPLPITEERQDALYDDANGVLPPRPLIIDEAPFPE